MLPHGGGVEAAARAWGCEAGEVLDLSTGLHPAGPPAWLGGWLREHASFAGRYPDADGEPARSALAAELGVRRDEVLIAAGAQAVIEVIFQAMGWRSFAIETPCYAEPLRCARRAGCRVHACARGRALQEAEAVWVTSPHNPDGGERVFPEGRPGVLDESYMPFAERCCMGLIPGVVRLGSLTKLFAIPGLRLGYVIAEPAIIERLRAWLPPWPASTLALHLLPRLLDEADARDAALVAARRRLAALLADAGWEMRPSRASFVLARPSGPMPDFAAHGILVRHFPEWPQLASWVRLGLPGGEDGWRRLEAALCP